MHILILGVNEVIMQPENARITQMIYKLHQKSILLGMVIKRSHTLESGRIYSAHQFVSMEHKNDHNHVKNAVNPLF